jgi:hypothetical protein
MYVNNGYARAIARTRVNYVVKNGFAFTFKPVKGASEADAETMQEWCAHTALTSLTDGTGIRSSR